MPSLCCKIKKLQYQKKLTDKEANRIINALKKKKLEEDFKREIAYANEDIDFAEGNEFEENFMRGYLGGILCAYRIVFGENYEEREEEE